MTTPRSSVPEIEWPALPAADAASALSVLWQIERSQWWPREVLLESQFEQLRELAGHAVANVPFYRDALKRAGIRSVRDLDPESYRRWPILRKSDLHEHEASLRASTLPREHGSIGYASSTGSTGTPVRVALTQAARFFSQILFLREHLLHDRDFTGKLALINSAAERAASPEWGTVGSIFRTGPSVTLNSSTAIDEQLAWLVAERPTYLLSQANNLRALLLRSRETGVRPQGMRQLVTLSDMPAPDLPELARDVWGASVAATYICEECGPIGFQVPGFAHYAVHAEFVYVEVLHDDGSSCAPGEIGRVVITPLHNFAMPLLRYEIGDYAEAGGECPSGRGLPVLTRIVGRSRNMARDPNGRQFWPSFPADLWLEVAPIRRLQLVQRTLSAIDVRYEAPRLLTDDETDRLRAALRKKLEYPYEIAFVRVDGTGVRPGGKFEDFISEIAG